MPSSSEPSDFLREFCTPIPRWSPRTRFLAGLVAVAVCLARAIYLVLHNESVFVMADAPFYLSIARGNYNEVVQPFASRPLGALVVAALVHVFHCTIERGFLIEAAASLLLMLAIVYFLVLKTKAPRWMLLAIAVIPFWGTLLQYLVIPDLWFSALLAIMLLCLARNHLLLASLMMFPLMLSRESASLTLVCFLIAAWSTLRWRDRIAAVLAAAAGAVIVGRFAAHAHSNVERLPQSVYMLAKVPWNFLHNVLGIVPWSNVYPGLCTVPAWSTPLHFGSVNAIGVCGFSAHSWQLLAQAFLTSFGLLPLLVAFLWKRRERPTKRSVLLRFSLLYGGISLLLTPLLGVWFVHLIGYAWPLFLIALPMLFDELPQASPTGSRAAAAVGFLCIHVLVCWVSYRWMWIPQLIIEAILWIIGFLLMRHWMGDARATRAESAPA